MIKKGTFIVLLTVACGLISANLSWAQPFLNEEQLFYQPGIPVNFIVPQPTVLNFNPFESVTTPEIIEATYPVPKTISPFTLRRVRIIGRSVFKPEQMAMTYRHFAGKRITKKEVLQILNNVGRLYEHNGYQLIDIEFAGINRRTGTLNIKITEGHITQYEIEGDAGKLAPLIELYAREMSRHRPVHQNMLSHYLLLINRNPGYKAASSFHKIPGRPGEYKVKFFVRFKRFDPQFTLNNLGSAFVDEIQMFGELNTRSVFKAGDNILIGGGMSPEFERFHSWTVGYNIPINDRGTRFNIVHLRSKSVPKPSIFTPAVYVGTIELISAMIEHPLIFQYDRRLILQGGVYGFNSVRSQLPIQLIDSRFRELKYGATYEVRKTKSILQFVLNATQSIDGLGTRQVVIRALPASLDFTKFNAYVQAARELPKNFSVQLLLGSQLAFSAVPIEESFFIGGQLFGRAYDNGEILGDSGMAGSVELRYTKPFDKTYLQEGQLYGYYDGGAVWRRGLPSNLTRFSAVSAGGGIRIQVTKRLKAAFEIAKPLTRKVLSQIARGKSGKEPRYNVTFDYQYDY